MTRSRLALWGVLGSLVLLALWSRPDLPPAWAQGVGIYSRASCSSANITNAVTGQTWCFDTVLRHLTVFNGTTFDQVSLDPLGVTTVVPGNGNITAGSFTTTNGNLTLTGGNNAVLFAATSANLSDSTSLLTLNLVPGTNGIGFYNAAGTVKVATISVTGVASFSAVNAGVLASQGAGTVSFASATFANGLSLDVASGSGINLTNIRGLSASSSKSNNLRGTCTFAAAATCAVTFASNEPDSNYFVMVGGIVNVSSKAVTGFTLTATGTNSNAVDWMLVR